MSIGTQLKVQLEAQKCLLQDRIKVTREEIVESIQRLHTLDEALEGM